MTALAPEPRWPGASEWSDESSRDVMRFVVESACMMTGFRYAVINVIHGSSYRAVSVCGEPDWPQLLLDTETARPMLADHLARAERWGRRFGFVCGRSQEPVDWGVVPHIPVPDSLDAWHPDDMLLAELHSADGDQIGFLSVDVPADLRRPPPESWPAMDRYAEHVETVVRLAVEREALKHDDERRVDDFDAITHELKNPLTVIEGHLDLLLADEVSLAQRFSLEAIGRASRRLQRLAEDLQGAGEAWAMTVGRDSGRIAVARLLRDVVGERRQPAEAAQVDVRLHPPGATVQAAGRRQDLELVVSNLVGNAVKYSEADDLVEVAARLEGDVVVVEVADQGLGISADDQARVFSDHFRSTNPEALERPGSGLGLGIVRRLVERAGGSIEVSSVLGRGSTFTVRWPAAATTA